MREEKQQLEDVPRTKNEERRQKGPMPLTAVFLCLGLAAVCVLFFGPALIGAAIHR
jgi:hypothetical protein